MNYFNKSDLRTLTVGEIELKIKMLEEELSILKDILEIRKKLDKMENVNQGVV